jgi:hypothetical protein
VRHSGVLDPSELLQADDVIPALGQRADSITLELHDRRNNAALLVAVRIPTTGAIFGSSLYVVNGRFDVASPFEPSPPNIFEIEFDVVKLPK